MDSRSFMKTLIVLFACVSLFCATQVFAQSPDPGNSPPPRRTQVVVPAWKIAPDSQHLYVLRGHTLFEYQIPGLTLTATVELPPPEESEEPSQ